YGFTYTSTTEQTYFTAFGEWADQVNYFDTGFQQLGRSSLLVIRRCFTVDRHSFLLADRATLVDWIAEYVHDAAESFSTNRYGNRSAGACNFQTAAQAFGGTHGNSADYTITQLLLYFQGEALVADG